MNVSISVWITEDLWFEYHEASSISPFCCHTTSLTVKTLTPDFYIFHETLLSPKVFFRQSLLKNMSFHRLWRGVKSKINRRLEFWSILSWLMFATFAEIWSERCHELQSNYDRTRDTLYLNVEHKDKKIAVATVRSTNTNTHRYTMQPIITLDDHLLLSILHIFLKQTKSHMRENIRSHLLKIFSKIITCTSSRKLTIYLVEQWREQVFISSLG